MGVQGAINSILGSAAVATGVANKVKQEKVEAAKKIADAKAAEDKEIADAKAKLADANQMALGYSEEELNKRKVGEALGLNQPQKMPRGVSKATYLRRFANLKSLEESQELSLQKKEVREMILNTPIQDISKTVKSEITKKGRKN